MDYVNATNRPFRHGKEYINSGIGTVVPFNNQNLKVRTADILYLGTLGPNFSNLEAQKHFTEIVTARAGDQFAIAGLKCVEQFVADSLMHRPGFACDNREQIEFKEKMTLAAHASRSVGAGNRIRPEEPDPYRTAYYRDLGRILHCFSVRRLVGKTQNLFTPISPTIHTRLFHSIKVAQLGESIGKGLGLNTDLIWAIGIGHDLGHAPFGHTGEMVLTEIGKKAFTDKNYQFKHNVHGARLVMELEKYFKDELGLNLTLEVIDGILHHNGESDEYILSPRDDLFYHQYLKTGKPLDPVTIRHLLDPRYEREAPLTWCGCVIRLADKIAYLPVDLEDALMSGLIREEDLLLEHRKLLTDIRRILGYSPSEMFGTMVSDVIETSRATGRIAMSERVAKAMLMLKKFDYEVIIAHPEKQEYESEVPGILEKLFHQFHNIEGEDIQTAIDHIASMTDQEAINRYTKFIPRSRR